MNPDALEAAKRILEVVPQSMGRIRKEMRQASPPDLSHSQFRIMGSVHRGRNLAGEIARHQGVSQPAMSKMIDALVEKGLVRRRIEAADRRRVPLELTAAGEELYIKIRKAAQQELGRLTAQLNATERRVLVAGLDRLERVLLLGRTESKR